jgi:hypothetical protein
LLQWYLLSPCRASTAVKRTSAFESDSARTISRLKSRNGSYVLEHVEHIVHFTCTHHKRHYYSFPSHLRKRKCFNISDYISSNSHQWFLEEAWKVMELSWNPNAWCTLRNRSITTHTI